MASRARSRIAPALPSLLRPLCLLVRAYPRRVAALVIDDLGMSFSNARYAREALQKFVNEQMQPGDLVSIVRTGAADFGAILDNAVFQHEASSLGSVGGLN